MALRRERTGTADSENAVESAAAWGRCAAPGAQARDAGGGRDEVTNSAIGPRVAGVRSLLAARRGCECD